MQREVVAYYVGQVVDMDEAREREDQYEATGKSCTLVDIGSAVKKAV